MLLRAPARLIFPALLFLSTICSAQQKWPSTLLWRITGNGLEKPSYLYGTMHMQDQRLFQFGDSLYHSLESVEGFALEVDFREFFDSIFHNQIKLQEQRMMDEEVVKIDSKKIDRTSDSIMKQLGIEPDQMTRQDLKRIRDYKMNKIVQQGEMQTIVDGFLYGIALRQHKWMGGIEDVNDQIQLFDEMGRDVDPEEVFEPESNIRSSLEHMVKTYQAQDLNSIARMADVDMSDEWRDELLIKRNVKMARRMDSLSAIRTMFFAVGCAHLPGDSGVINLLRSRGFTVLPVFSSKKISAEVYASKLSKIDWVDVADEDKLYKVQMPGVPSDYDIFGQAMKIKMFFDLPTMTVYMTGHTIGRFETNAGAEEMLLNMIDRMGGVKNSLKKKFISKGDIKGIDGSFDYQGGAYRIELLQKNNTLFMLMVGSSKRSNVSGSDVEHYFSSFRALETSTEKQPMVSFTIPGKGFSILLPGQPKPNTAIDNQAAATMWNFHTYDYVDNAKGLYYLIQAKETRETYIIPGDSVYFDNYIQEMQTRLDSTIHLERTYVQGYPALYMDGFSTKEHVLFKTLQVVRGNRVYAIVVGGQEGSDFSGIPAIFQSFTLVDYPEKTWKTVQGEGYFTTAPGPIHKKEPEDKESSPVQVQSSVYNEANAVSYQVFKQPLSYYWYRNDSSLFAMQINNNKDVEDSVLSRRITANGSLKGLEIVVQSPNNNSLKKLRFFVNGDTLYTIMARLPAQLINDRQEEKFFDDFRVINEIPPTIFTSKARKLLEDLFSEDSVKAAAAATALSAVVFSKEDLPLLHEALLKPYADSLELYGTLYDLILQIKPLADSTTIRFVADHYSEFMFKHGVQYNLLYLLSKIQTQRSYAELKKLVLLQLPLSGNSNSLRFALQDSLLLTKTLYPQILTLANDSLFREVLPYVTNTLLDSNLLVVADIQPAHDLLIHEAGDALSLIRQDPERDWEADAIMQLIARFNDKSSNEMLQRYLKTNPIHTKEKAAVYLAANHQAVSSAELLKIAADYHYRLDLYRDLKKINQLHLFPSAYASQKMLAQADLYHVFYNDDYSISKIEFIGERIKSFMGKKQKFYLFKVLFGEDDGAETYLGVSGPYALDEKQLETSSEATGVATEGYDKTQVDAQFRKLLADTENWLRENEQKTGDKK